MSDLSNYSLESRHHFNSKQDKEENNLEIRLKEIEKIINNECPNSAIKFQIPKELFDEMFHGIKPEIYDHTRVHSTKCKERINDESQYRKPARNMLNRWKPAILGNHVLHKIIFIYLYNVCTIRAFFFFFFFLISMCDFLYSYSYIDRN